MSDPALEPDRLGPEQLEDWRSDTRSRLADLRVSVSRLATEAGVPDSTLRSWLFRRPGPNLWGRQQIAAALDRLGRSITPDAEDTSEDQAWRQAVQEQLGRDEITIRRLADTAGVSESALRTWLKGPRAPKAENRAKVDAALHKLAIPRIDQPSSATE